jgi:hypothetical protein
MEIHKPKPWHGWREFLKEYAIVVIGVLTALAGEQFVEMLHWRHVVEVERQAMLAEVRGNLGAVQARVNLQPCVSRRLEELQLVFQRRARGEPLGVKGAVGVPVPLGSSKDSWNIAISSQGLSHVPYEEQVELSSAFTNFANWDNIRQEEREAWVKLAALDQPEGLTDSDWAQLRQAYVQARAASRRVAQVGPFILAKETVGQKPDQSLSPAELFKAAGYGGELCQPLI